MHARTRGLARSHRFDVREDVTIQKNKEPVARCRTTGMTPIFFGGGNYFFSTSQIFRKRTGSLWF